MTDARSRSRLATTPGALAAALLAATTLAACGSDGGGDGGGATHPVETVNGTVDVPDDPQRVVVLDTGELDTALTLGFTPVGSVHAVEENDFLGYFPDGLQQGITDVGAIGSPNLELIHELDPDLIIGNMVRDADRYDELSRIAPTVLAEGVGVTWKENFRLHAEALGVTPQAKRVAADYKDHASEVTDALGGPDAAAALKVSALRFVAGADARLYGPESFIGTVLADAGLGRPDIVEEAEDGFAVEISPEQVDKGDGDAVFYSSYGSSDESGEDAAVGGPLWDTLTAVQNDMAFPVDDDLWFLGIGYTAANLILDELAQHLAQTDAQHP